MPGIRNDEHVQELINAIVSLQNTEDCADFFEDLCTVAELKAMAQRFHVARLLSEKKIYNDIVSETQASTATISRVNRALLYGSGGYAKILRKQAEENKK